MKRSAILIVVVAVLACAPLAEAASDKLITDVAAQTADSLAFVTCEFDEDSATSAVSGPAVCIDKSGLFISLAFNASMRHAKVKECKIMRPGLESSPLTAEIVSIDRETGMAFVKCTDASAPKKWLPVVFANSSDLTVGMEVVSVSLMAGDAARSRYFGRASISAIRNVPQPLVYVTGGRLTGVCSPVFTGPGKAIGLVWRQSPQIVELTFGRQRGMARIRPMQECAFFTPVEEFIHVIRTKGKRQLAWTGILGLRPADEELLSTSKPGIRVSKIMPGGPADKAGLKELDVIVKVDGKDLPKTPSPAFTVAELEWKLNRMEVGSKVVFRLASKKDVEITLTARPDGPTEVPRYASRRLGMLARDKSIMDPFISTNPALKAKGVIVATVGRDSPAVKGDLQRGDVITSIDAQPVQNVATMRKLLTNLLADGKEKKIAVMVQRKSESVPLIIKVPKKQ